MNITDKIRITNEDNMELMARYPDNYFTLGATDVPYGIDVANMAFGKETKTTVKQKKRNSVEPK